MPESPVEVAAASELSVIVRTDSGAYYSCVTSSPGVCWQITLAPAQAMSGREGRVYPAVLQKDASKYEVVFSTGLFLTIALIPAAAGLLVIHPGTCIRAFAHWMMY